MSARPSRRASRPAGPVTPETDQLVGTWTRADDVTPAAPLPTGTAELPLARQPGTGGVGPGPAAASGRDTDDRSGGRVRPRRRVTTQPVPGYVPSPAPEPARHRDGENDDQLRRDVPPHW